MKVIKLDPEKWIRGRGSSGSRLLCDDGMCCMGFAALQHGGATEGSIVGSAYARVSIWDKLLDECDSPHKASELSLVHTKDLSAELSSGTRKLAPFDLDAVYRINDARWDVDEHGRVRYGDDHQPVEITDERRIEMLNAVTEKYGFKFELEEVAA